MVLFVNETCTYISHVIKNKNEAGAENGTVECEHEEEIVCILLY